jgi:hypothetical protein
MRFTTTPYMKHLSLFGLLALAFSTTATAQHPEFLRAERLGGPNNDRMSAVDLDASGNSYGVHNFTGSVSLDINNETVSFTSNGQRDILVIKKNTLGHVEWAQQFGGPSNDEVTSIAHSISGNIYFTGSFSGSVTFGEGATSNELTSVGSSDIFIVKLTESGIFQWATSFGQTGSDLGRRIAVDEQDNIYLAGEVNQSNSNICLTKYTSEGTLEWTKTIGGNGIDMSTALNVDNSGKILLTGTFSGTTTFAQGVTLSAQNSTDSFVALFENNGDLNWIQQMGGANSSSGVTPVDAAFDGQGGIILAGNFSGEAQFHGTTPLLLEGIGVVDIFYARLLLDGTLAWVKTTGGEFNDQAIAISIDQENHFYVTGIINNESDFDPSDGSFTLVSDGSNDGFAAKYTLDGEFLWAERFGGVNSDFGLDLVIDPTGDLTVVGIFSGAAYFGTGENPTLLISEGGDDVFILTYDVCHATEEAQTIVGCSPFELNEVVYTESGQFTHVTTNEGGCAHTIQLELQLTTGDVAVEMVSNALHAISSSTALQWINCSNGLAIDGETAATFQPTESGSYAVQAVFGDCTYTSDCMDYTFVGVEEMHIKGALVLFPNPGNGLVRLNLNDQSKPLQVNVLNHVGQQIYNHQNFINGEWLSLDEPNGVYYIQVTDGEEIETIKYILQR